MAYAQHATEVIVHRSGEYTTQNYPQICRGTELGAHDGAKDGTRSRYVEELDHEYLPSWQYHEIHSISLGHGWGGAVVGTKHADYELAIDHISRNERQKADYKCYHLDKFALNHGQK